MVLLSPWHISGAGGQVTLTPVSNGNPGDDFEGGLGFSDGQIWENGPRPGRVVSAMEEKM